jgi:hypothetical protein
MSKAADEEILALSLIRKILASFEAELKRGSLITVKALKTTCHRLPIGIPE